MMSANVGIDGHLDLKAASPSFLRVEVHEATCADDGLYYCELERGTYNQAKALYITTAIICG